MREGGLGGLHRPGGDPLIARKRDPEIRRPGPQGGRTPHRPRLPRHHGRGGFSADRGRGRPPGPQRPHRLRGNLRFSWYQRASNLITDFRTGTGQQWPGDGQIRDWLFSAGLERELWPAGRGCWKPGLLCLCVQQRGHGRGGQHRRDGFHRLHGSREFRSGRPAGTSIVSRDSQWPTGLHSGLRSGTAGHLWRSGADGLHRSGGYRHARPDRRHRQVRIAPLTSPVPRQVRLGT